MDRSKDNTLLTTRMGDVIIGVQFGIANPDEIAKRSVVQVITDKAYQAGHPVPGGVFDAHFGTINNGERCPTCKQTNILCPGHFGHIQLARPVYLYQFIDPIQKFLLLVCLNCSNPYLPDEELEAISAKLTGMDRFQAVRESTEEYKKKFLKATGGCAHCSSPVITKISKKDDTVAKLMAMTADEDAEPIVLQTEMVLRTFQRITDRHVDLIGFSSKFSRPDWMICTVLAVPPLTVRPSVIMEDNQRMEDDLTHILIDIVRNNRALQDRIDKGDSADSIEKHTELLQFYVATYVDNDIKGLPPAAQRSGRPLKTLKSRLGAKTGRVRGNLMGKRVDFSARSVITPDPNIDVDELGVPEEIARNLTFPEIVTVYNRDRLMSYVRNGPGKYPGAKSVFKKHDNKTVNLKFINPETLDLKQGDIVNRHLIDGDVVLFNRQPSLHKASMECHRIRVLPFSTFRLNVSATKPYNADFDGDEMNMHVPQSIASASELKYLATVLRQIVSPRTNSPIIRIIQDTMTGSYRLSKDSVKVPEHIAMNIMARMKKPLSSYRRKDREITGKEIFSTAFPLMNLNGQITVENGVLTKGLVKAGAYDSASKGAIHVIFNDFGPKRAGQFIDDIQNIVTKYNLFSGFSVGPSDLIMDAKTETEVQKIISDGKQNVANLMTQMHAGTFLNGDGREPGAQMEIEIMKIIADTNRTIEELVKNSMPDDNRMYQMVESGSKGKMLNITQMMAMLSQQNVASKRIQYSLQDRTLPHFHRFDDGLESRGFVESSFIGGIRPAEFFFHAMGGREGLIDTAVKTSDSGYIQRRLVKTMEDIHVEYDGTVRNVNGAIVQFYYGGDGADSTCIEKYECSLALMTLEQIYRDFAISADDISAVVKGEVSDFPDMVDEIIDDRDVLVRDVFRYTKNEDVFVPVHLGRITEKYTNPYSVKTDLTPAYVVDELTKMCAQSWLHHNKLFQILLRFYFAPKKSILKMRLTRAMFDEMLKDVHFRYTKSLVHAGEMVGTLAAQSVGEPTTQLTLNTFHSAGTANANATEGVPRIMELLGASPNPKTPLNVVYLDASIAGTLEAVIAKKREIQKTTLRNITKSVRIYYDPNPLSTSTAVQEDRDILQSYQKFSVTNGQLCTSPWVMRLELDTEEIAARQVIDMTIIAAKIQNNRVLKVFECIHTDTNAPDKLVLRIVFGADAVKNMLSLRFIEDKLLDTVLTGVEGIGNVYVREVKDHMMYDEKVGGWVAAKQHVLDVEGTNLLDLSTIPNTDPFRSFSNDIHEIKQVFGIETARIALLREFKSVFSREYINYHHLITLVDAMTYPGFFLKADRTGMSKNTENGVLAKSSFEETAKHLFNAALMGESDNMRGVSANIMFGQKPPCGTGFVDILVDETKLPEGTEEDHVMFEEERRAVSALVEQESEKESSISMSDVMMSFD
uniref:DNA-directed RNA polymerase n=1 Tax=viral metagenome TaxID=1070528 RepID=A0A6C0AJ90_9ZZZZ